MTKFWKIALALSLLLNLLSLGVSYVSYANTRYEFTPAWYEAQQLKIDIEKLHAELETLKEASCQKP